MPLKKSKGKSSRTSDDLKVAAEAMRYLRTVSLIESFYFYEGMDKPTGLKASSLPEFLETVKSVKTESLLFHHERKDFQNWIQKTIGDGTLARRIANVSLKQDSNKVRAKIRSTLEKRVRELAGSQASILVDTNQMIPSRELEA